MRRPINFLFLGILCLSVFSLSCEKDENNDPLPTDASFQGMFVDAVHQTSGTASINQDETVLTLTNFKTDNGPDLNIYLASNINNVEGDFIDLGNIKGTDGTYTYDLPSGTDYLAYKYVVVWCVDFSVNFGWAELEEL